MDKVIITNKDGNKEEMEVVTIFSLSNSNYNYIIYKSSDNEYFVGKYLGDEIVDLITDLSAQEMKYCNEIFKGLMGE